ncbi:MULTISPECIES: ABC transporter ATP-binding protein [unclassified Aminobacter]|uniref:ABC transporter ATP-binding protein n=1 Tax=unclassified Aminobacter TaxID=2644704 RepID=UPI0004B6257D|nr:MULTISPECIES: ABC transporter ATP-binding protein [unclassified Aminobacter]TWG67558.1 branched-chain amino acid transport system ATP-binding protein/branched-chain amino acid transport system ATP-binding protein [Aminobacter sp. J44]TWH35523.1 branched-chain amino acid transport system ATP-binding protein/branched-chain amino acid transport system ATP-binding protein [Aminobacter sp. J15]
MAETKPIVLQTEALTKNFGALQVTRSVSLKLPHGCRHALIGPNGAGKTTLINLITGQLKPDSGRIILDGNDITDAPVAARVRKGLTRTFQINTLFPDLTPLEAVTLAVCERQKVTGQFWRGLSAQQEAIDEAYDILEKLKLGDVATRTTRTLAYGRQRLLEIALALATRPKVLLLDEPAAGVPKDESQMLFSVISSLPEDMSILFIEHDMDIVFRFASRIVVLVAGGLLVEDTPDAVRSDERVREVYLGQAHHG